MKAKSNKCSLQYLGENANMFAIRDTSCRFIYISLIRRDNSRELTVFASKSLLIIKFRSVIEFNYST